MADLAFLEYTFLFDPLDTWQSLSQFESQFADFLAGRGLEAKYLNSVDPRTGKRICMIVNRQKIDLLREETNAKEGLPDDGQRTMKARLKEFRGKKYYGGSK